MIIYQGSKKGCVSCSIAYLSGQEDWESLFNACGGDFTSPFEALEVARGWKWIRFWLPIPSFLARFIARFVPVMIGVPMQRLVWSGTSPKNPIRWHGVNDEDHMVVLIGQTENGDIQIVNWDNPKKQDIRILDRNYPIRSAFIVIK